MMIIVLAVAIARKSEERIKMQFEELVQWKKDGLFHLSLKTGDKISLCKRTLEGMIFTLKSTWDYVCPVCELEFDN